MLISNTLNFEYTLTEVNVVGPNVLKAKQGARLCYSSHFTDRDSRPRLQQMLHGAPRSNTYCMMHALQRQGQQNFEYNDRGKKRTAGQQN